MYTVIEAWDFVYVISCSQRMVLEKKWLTVQVLYRRNLVQDNLSFESIVVAILKNCLIPSNETPSCSVLRL